MQRLRCHRNQLWLQENCYAPFFLRPYVTTEVSLDRWFCGAQVMSGSNSAWHEAMPGRVHAIIQGIKMLRSLLSIGSDLYRESVSNASVDNPSVDHVVTFTCRS